MKKNLIAFLLIFISNCLFAVDISKFTVGVEGALGTDFEFVEVKSRGERITDNVLGFKLGLASDYTYTECLAARFKVMFDCATLLSFNGGCADFLFLTVDVPVLFKFTLPESERVPGKFSFFAGPDFIFDLFSSGNSQTDNDSAKEKDSRIHSNDILGVGIETGFEYTFKNPSGFRIGFSASGDFIKFTQLTDSYKMKRICLMPYISYWF